MTTPSGTNMADTFAPEWSGHESVIKPLDAPLLPISTETGGAAAAGQGAPSRLGMNPAGSFPMGQGFHPGFPVPGREAVAHGRRRRGMPRSMSFSGDVCTGKSQGVDQTGSSSRQEANALEQVGRRQRRRPPHSSRGASVPAFTNTP